MNLELFLEHHGLSQNPFNAEEARHDAVFAKLAVQAQQNHPDFAKIAGKVDHPSSSVVFGEKGSGKTATRLLIDQRITYHNEAYPDKRIVLVAYDDLNPVLDNFLRHKPTKQGLLSKVKKDKPLERFRLADHQDAMLSQAVTRMVDGLTEAAHEKADPLVMPKLTGKLIRSIPRQARLDALILAALYDQPRSGSAIARWHKLRKKLRMGSWLPVALVLWVAWLMTIITAAAAVTGYLDRLDWVKTYAWLLPLSGALAVVTGAIWVGWLWRRWKISHLGKAIKRDTPTIQREPRRVAKLLSKLCAADRAGQPWPDGAVQSDSRYALTQRFLGFLGHLGYVGMTVLVDRVDEPAVISGNPERMRAIVWPMLDNKFLQQESVGVKLLLPIELRHMLHRQDAEFFQTARLDKQHTIDRLVWSGSTLYDICSARLTACHRNSSEPAYLTDLFEQPVTREVLIESLDDMQQPREAFKFLYSVIQEHCRMSPQEQPQFLIPPLTLQSVRRQHAQRIQDLRHGVAPA